MLSGRRKGFAGIEALLAALFTALLVAVSSGMLISSARIIYAYEQKMELERARRELLIGMRVPSGHTAERGTLSSGFEFVRTQRTKDFEVWEISKQGIDRLVRGTLFFAPK